MPDNFVIIYELLDEMMDFGYPQVTSPAHYTRAHVLPCTPCPGSLLQIAPRIHTKCFDHKSQHSLCVSPQTTEPKILREYILQEGNKLEVYLAISTFIVAIQLAADSAYTRHNPEI